MRNSKHQRMPCRHMASALMWQPACSGSRPLQKRSPAPRCGTCLRSATSKLTLFASSPSATAVSDHLLFYKKVSPHPDSKAQRRALQVGFTCDAKVVEEAIYVRDSP